MNVKIQVGFITLKSLIVIKRCKTMEKTKTCCYCGNEIKDGKLFHKMCLIDDIYQTIYDSKPITKNLYCRCKDSGISTKEIRSDVEEDKKGRLKYTYGI